MALRPEHEARVLACEAQAEAARAAAAALTTEVDKIIDDDNAVPDETFDDPSVVRHIDELGRSAVRAQREASGALRRVASSYTAVTRSRR